jgi:translation initiation factor eIF-2B subunit delta
MILKKAHGEGKKFKVIVTDSQPGNEGKELLRRLVKAGIMCNYILIDAASYVIKEVTKVFVGAHTLMSNGCLISRVGTGMIGLLAHTYHIPFIVACETYKFTERVQLEAISFNELGMEKQPNFFFADHLTK